jgi:hypothetical protein
VSKEAQVKKWVKFASGEWTRTAPKNPGQYPTVADGELRTRLRGVGSVGFEGWWWSEPYPALPPLPKPEVAAPVRVTKL